MELIRKRWEIIFKGLGKSPFLYFGVILVSLIIFSFFWSANRSPNLVDLSLWGKELRNIHPFLTPTSPIKESPDLYFFQKNSLASLSPPIVVTPQVLGALAEGIEFEEIKKEVTEYIVEPGDNLWQISKKFNISLETILWANDLHKDTLIQPGQKLIILPVSGVIHHVQKGDTLSQIAKTYQAKVEEIIAFNDLSGEEIFIGDILIIPNGIMPSPQRYVPKWVSIASSYFICPISPPCRITQGLHWYNAVDLSHGKCGEPVYAAAGGRVLKVRLTSSRSKWSFGGKGNHLTILHPNGVVTYYGHIQTALVNPGDYVSQGQIIATIGGYPGTPGAGLSTGCHLHFGVRGAKNPFGK